MAMSVNFWWWPIHNDAAMERWSYQNEVESWENRRATLPAGAPPMDRRGHGLSFHKLTAEKRAEAAIDKPWPSAPLPEDEPVPSTPPPMRFELVD